MRERAVANPIVIAFHGHDEDDKVEGVSARAEEVVYRLLQNGCLIADILEVQILWNVAGVLAVGNELGFLVAVNINASSSKSQGVDVLLVRIDDANRPTSTLRCFLDRQNACCRLEMINKVLPVHSAIPKIRLLHYNSLIQTHISTPFAIAVGTLVVNYGVNRAAVLAEPEGFQLVLVPVLFMDGYDVVLADPFFGLLAI